MWDYGRAFEMFYNQPHPVRKKVTGDPPVCICACTSTSKVPGLRPCDGNG